MKKEKKICILNTDISSVLQCKIENGKLDFEKDVSLDNLFIEVVFQDKDENANPVVIDVVSSKHTKKKYLDKYKKDFTIVQVSFFMIEENNRPYLITRGDNHIVTKGLSVLFNLKKLVIDDSLDTVESAITEVIDKMIYLDDNKSYFGGNGFVDFFKHNRLKYIIQVYGNGFNNPDKNKASYIFFTYSVLVKDEKSLKVKSKKTFFLFQNKNEKEFFYDTFDIAPDDFESGFKEWLESFGVNKIKCKYCFEGSYDICLLESYTYKKSICRFEKAFFIKRDDALTKIHISKYENLFSRMRVTIINSVKDNTVKSFMKVPEKIIYGLLSALLASLLVTFVNGGIYLKIIMYFIGAILLVPITRILIEIFFEKYIFAPQNKNNKD